MNNLREAYDNWSAKYDSDVNLTRDLDRIITKKTLINLNCKSIVEIGCGTGKNTLFLSQIGSQVQAIDFSEAMINKAKEKLNSDNITFLVSDITEKWICGDRSVDLITCNLVLEHIKEISFIFSEAYRVLINGGIFFISELHPFKQYLGAKANFKINEEIIEISSFVHHISEFFNIARDNGFTIENFQECWHEADVNKPPRLISFFFRKQE
jgi:ubiquinone/menaquinone biosynthesis C-methylase UbiE